MNKCLSYCGLVDPRISASDKDLPVKNMINEALKIYGSPKLSMYCYVMKLLFLTTESYFTNQDVTFIYSEVLEQSNTQL